MKFVASSLLISGLETVKERKMSPSQQTQTAQKINRSDEGLTLKTSAFLPFTVANLRFQPSC